MISVLQKTKKTDRFILAIFVAIFLTLTMILFFATIGGNQ